MAAAAIAAQQAQVIGTCRRIILLSLRRNESVGILTKHHIAICSKTGGKKI